MILLLGLALAADVDLERARQALQGEQPAVALAHARVALEEAPGDWRALRLYARALEATGQGVLVGPELLAFPAPQADIVLAWHQAELTGDTRPLAVHEEELAALALADVALDRGEAAIALPLAEAASLPEARALELEALLALERGREATALARRIARDHPDRPDLLLPLFRAESPERARRRAVQSAEVAGETDPAVLYRALRLLVEAGEQAAAARAAERLVHMGEPEVPTRPPWEPAARREVARALGMRRDPTIPGGTPSEVRELGLAVARTLRDLGRVEEALAVFEDVRRRADATPLALAHGEQLLRMGRAREALEVADEARALAVAPTPEDLARLSTRGWRSDLGAAWVLTAAALLALDERDRALEAAATAALLEPSADAWAILGRAQAVLGQEEAAFASLSVAQTLGAPVGGELAAVYPGAGAWEDAAFAVADLWARQSDAPVLEAAAPPSDRPRIGAPMPDWAVGEASAASTRGQVVVLAFWASWCGPCKTELPALARMAREMRQEERAVTFVAVSLDERIPDYERFVARADLQGLVIGRQPELGRRLRVSALPTTWIIDAQGTVRHHHQGYGPGSDTRIEREVAALLDAHDPESGSDGPAGGSRNIME